jgi:hypothetical protein
MRAENSESFESVSPLHPSWRRDASEVTITRTMMKQQGMCARSFGTETWSGSYIEDLGLATRFYSFGKNNLNLVHALLCLAMM